MMADLRVGGFGRLRGLEGWSDLGADSLALARLVGLDDDLGGDTFGVEVAGTAGVLSSFSSEDEELELRLLQLSES